MEEVLVYHLQSGGLSHSAVITFKTLHPRSVSVMLGLFGHRQFYSCIESDLDVCVCPCGFKCVFLKKKQKKTCMCFHSYLIKSSDFRLVWLVHHIVF